MLPQYSDPTERARLLRRAQRELERIRDDIIRELTALPECRRMSESEADVEIYPDGFEYYESMSIVHDVLHYYGFVSLGGHHLPYGTGLWWRGEDGVVVRVRTNGEVFNPMTQLEVLIPPVFPTGEMIKSGKFFAVIEETH